MRVFYLIDQKQNEKDKKLQSETAQFYYTAYFFTHNSSQDELLSGNEWSKRTDRELIGKTVPFSSTQNLITVDFPHAQYNTCTDLLTTTSLS